MPQFLNGKPELLIVYNNNLENSEGIPSNLFLRNREYHLLGFTAFLTDHFVLRLYNGKDYYLFDNLLKNVHTKETENEKNLWEITCIFYELL